MEALYANPPATAVGNALKSPNVTTPLTFVFKDSKLLDFIKKKSPELPASFINYALPVTPKLLDIWADPVNGKLLALANWVSITLFIATL